MNKIIVYNKPYLIFNIKNFKKDLGILSGLIDLLNNCTTKKEFEKKLNYHLNSLFVTEEIKNKIVYNVNLNIKLRGIFKKNLKIKKEKKVEFTNDTDLMSFDHINDVDKDDIFTIYDKIEEKKYWFQTDTLVKLINQSLTNSDNIMEINSKNPYNPYNRKDFNKLELNSIYNYLIKKNKLPILLHLYKTSNYNINNFIYVNRIFLDDYIIKNIDDEEPIELIRYFEQICNDNNINFTRYDIISNNLEKYIEYIKDVIRFSYHSNFRDLPLKKMIEYFIDNEIYDKEENIELIENQLNMSNIESLYYDLSERLNELDVYNEELV